MMTLEQLINEHGDIVLNREFLEILGFSEKQKMDKMLRAKDVSRLMGWSTGKASDVITKLKIQNDCEYEELCISASILCQAYHMEVNEALFYLESIAKNGPARTEPKNK